MAKNKKNKNNKAEFAKEPAFFNDQLGENASEETGKYANKGKKKK